MDSESGTHLQLSRLGSGQSRRQFRLLLVGLKGLVHLHILARVTTCSD
jgi:hypothetical protein